jgi:hypothetical protein
MRSALAVVIAFTAASLYALATSLQALEARRMPRSTALRAGLIARLARRPLWLGGTAAGIVAWPVQAAALALGSVALVQPAIGFGLVVLLALGVTVLHERLGAREVAGACAIAVAVGALGWAAPAQTGAFTRTGTWVVGAGALMLAPMPLVLRRSGGVGGLATSLGAGCAWTWVALATALLDGSFADRKLVWAAVWAAAAAAAGWGGLLAEMTSLQTWPATRAIPLAFGLEMLLPAVLQPLLTHGSVPHPGAFAVALGLACAGAVLLGGSRAVARAAAPLTKP